MIQDTHRLSVVTVVGENNISWKETIKQVKHGGKQGTNYRVGGYLYQTAGHSSCKRKTVIYTCATKREEENRRDQLRHEK